MIGLKKILSLFWVIVLMTITASCARSLENTSEDFFSNHLDNIVAEKSTEEMRFLLYVSDDCYICSGAEWEEINSELVVFNISQFPNVSSCKYIIQACTTDATNSYSIELFNKTDNQVIKSSRIDSNNEILAWVYSSEFLEEFPAKNIQLNLRIKSEHEGVKVYLKEAYLILYMDNSVI